MKAIYLDTHHLSRMVSGRSQLERFISNPAYSFVFSTSHVVECLPKEPRENPGSIVQLKIILNPQAKWLVGWGTLVSMEKLNPSLQLHQLFCSKDQLLFPDLKIERSDWIKRSREGIKEMLKERIPDRNLRRSVQAKLLKQGKLTPEAFQMIKEGTLNDDPAKLPYMESRLAELNIVGFLEGRVSEDEFRLKFLEAVANPIALATMTSMPELESILNLSRVFWSQMDDLAEILSKFIQSVRRELAQFGASDYAKGKIHIKQHLKKNDFRSALVRRFSSVEVGVDELSKMAGTRLFVDVFAEYVLEKLDQYVSPLSGEFRSDPKFKRSDAADFTHLFYYPYVDVFGCDGAMYNRIKKAGWPTEKVVTTDDELESKLIEIIPE